jgi:hypothetical protein
MLISQSCRAYGTQNTTGGEVSRQGEKILLSALHLQESSRYRDSQGLALVFYMVRSAWQCLKTQDRPVITSAMGGVTSHLVP